MLIQIFSSVSNIKKAHLSYLQCGDYIIYGCYFKCHQRSSHLSRRWDKIVSETSEI